jgi:WD40 repeat protein
MPLRIGQRRVLSDKNGVARNPQVRWARWLDSQHVVAVIDQSLGLWNIVSGEQIYRLVGIDARAEPAVSSGRRYLAVPIEGSVLLLSAHTGRTLGRIEVEKQVVPAVSFSPLGHRLAITTSRQLRTWDLASAAVSAQVESRRSLGSGPPQWVDSDLILSDAGVLLSEFRGIPVWHYDIAASAISTLGRQVVVFRKHPLSELTMLSLPHPGAADAMYWIDHGPTGPDRDARRLPGRSVWGVDGWQDRDVQISAASSRLK